MHFPSIALYLATALPLVWSVPEYFFLQAKTAGLYNDFYLTGNSPPSFSKLNAHAFAFNFLKAPSNLYYLGYNATSLNKGARAVMDINSAPFADWEPVSFVTAGNGNSTLQNRFFINGTGSDEKLQWKNSHKSDVIFSNWLICKWSYLVPQLFFLTGPLSSKELPRECIVADLMVIPIPNSS